MRGMVGRVALHLRDPLYRDAWFLMGNSILGAVTGFLFWLVAARVATTTEIGGAAAAVSAFTLAALLGKLGADAVLVRHAPDLVLDDRRRLFTRVMVAAVAATAFTAISFAALAHAVPVFPAVGAGEAALFVAFAVAVVAGWVLDAWFVAERRAGRSLLRNVVFNVARLAFVAAPLVGFASPGLAVAWGAAAALSLLVATFLPRRPTGPARPLPSIARTAMANHVVNLGEFLPGLVLPVLVTALLGADANAAFYVAWTLAMVPFLASKAIAQSTFAEMSGGDAGTALARGVRLHLIAIAPAVVVGILAGPWALGLFGASYRAAWGLLAVLFVALVPAAVNNLAMATFKATDRRVALVTFSTATLVLTAAGAMLLAPRLGILAPGLAWLAANLAALPWTLPALTSRRCAPLERRLGRPAHEG